LRLLPQKRGYFVFAADAAKTSFLLFAADAAKRVSCFLRLMPQNEFFLRHQPQSKRNKS